MAAEDLVERRSIDVVPDDERHGTAFSQFTLWLGANLQITAVVTGALAVVFGGDVVWSVVGLLLGNLLGGAVMALHSAQGPKLGLPQMIQSRAQFGVRGAVVPLLLVILMYVGFFASGSVLAGQATARLTHTDDTTGIIAFALITAVAAAVGYRVIHVLGRVASVVCALAFVYLGIRLLDRVDLSALLGDAHFDLPMFLLAVSLSASWQLAFGPYVADYSRYLPRTTSGRATFWWTLSGSAVGSQWSMTFGVLVAASSGEAFLADQVGYVVGLGGTGLIASFLYFSIALGKLTINVLNTYGGFMSMVTGISGFRGQKALSQRGRAAYIALIMVAGTAVALLGKDSFLTSFKDFLLFLLTFFTPWSAINLVDYYLISRERYDIPALFDPRGRYGAWRWDALLVYGVGVLAQLPFLVTHFYTGPLAAPLGGADISWIVGLAVPAALYWLLARRDTSHIPEETRYTLASGPAH
ncbi:MULTISPECIES: cytosine permease [Streptomyces]|uniref:Cytosine permease n=1 Tax=Streptomyces silvae TaxID=2803812 RepID=A0ABU8ABN8_9ACTN|nr:MULTISPECIES: cytosine permease [unclassified Streptomyces]WSS72639.1 cytosine permease [Streptomyces sp. NBC_01175]WSS79677.1 cytosine permease [Streptomyces sp. NBC_01174]MDX3324378.1 cytosine permease [Streptomyces sp. ME02-6979-3A]MDX3427405.1 cytosine permease [Streptomyces sp. ME01-18a]RPK36036.1 allantoin permease [Streptomyces sp. ADI93-02]